MRRTLLALVGLTLASGTAYAVTVDFDGLAPGFYTEAAFNALFGATFDNTTAGGFHVAAQVNNPLYPDFTRPNAVLNDRYFDAANTTRVTFAGPVSFVSVTMGDFDQDPDALHLRAYNAGNILVGSDFFQNPPDSYAGHTLGVVAGDIAWIEFWADGLDDANNVYWDNLAWEPVPEPSTLALLGVGLALLEARRRRAGRR